MRLVLTPKVTHQGREVSVGGQGLPGGAGLREGGEAGAATLGTPHSPPTAPRTKSWGAELAVSEVGWGGGPDPGDDGES